MAGMNASAADLFGTPLLPGLATIHDLVTRDEEAALIARIDGEALTPFRFQGWTGKRLTRSFGWRYDFETGRALPLAEEQPSRVS